MENIDASATKQKMSKGVAFLELIRLSLVILYNEAN